MDVFWALYFPFFIQKLIRNNTPPEFFNLKMNPGQDSIIVYTETKYFECCNRWHITSFHSTFRWNESHDNNKEWSRKDNYKRYSRDMKLSILYTTSLHLSPDSEGIERWQNVENIVSIRPQVHNKFIATSRWWSKSKNYVGTSSC